MDESSGVGNSVPLTDRPCAGVFVWPQPCVHLCGA